MKKKKSALNTLGTYAANKIKKFEAHSKNYICRL